MHIYIRNLKVTQKYDLNIIYLVINENIKNIIGYIAFKRIKLSRYIKTSYIMKQLKSCILTFLGLNRLAYVWD